MSTSTQYTHYLGLSVGVIEPPSTAASATKLSVSVMPIGILQNRALPKRTACVLAAITSKIYVAIASTAKSVSTS